jgi:hypothetical protein
VETAKQFTALLHSAGKVKKSCPATTMQATRGKEGKLLLILDLSTRWGKWSASHLDHILPPGKGPLVPTGQKAGWASELVWSQDDRGKYSASARDLTVVCSQILYWLSYTSSYYKLQSDQNRIHSNYVRITKPKLGGGNLGKECEIILQIGIPLCFIVCQ